MAPCPQHDLRTIAFCCLGTGVFGFPNARAAWLALHTVRSWLETSGKADRLDGIIFVTFQAVDHEAYLHLLPKVRGNSVHSCAIAVFSVVVGILIMCRGLPWEVALDLVGHGQPRSTKLLLPN
eukprot:EG_transcript_41764